jgi:hypothetical protein
MLAKSVIGAALLGRDPDLGGAGWLLNLTQKHWSSSRADSLFRYPRPIVAIKR